MNHQMKKLPELEGRRVELLKQIQQEKPPAGSATRHELEIVESFIKLRKREQEPASKTYRYRVG